MFDNDLYDQVLAFVQSKGRYVGFIELCREFRKSRIYFTYRGINITQVNLAAGFVRRPPSKWEASKGLTRCQVEEVLRSTVMAEGRYLTITDVCRKLKVFHERDLRAFEINMHDISASCGFHKRSPYYKLDNANLESSIRDYISCKNRYVSQQEICETFNISLSFLTKSGIDTLAINAAFDFYGSYSWFERVVEEALLSIDVGDVIRQKTFDGCLSDLGKNLRFDFFLEKHNMCIEADGPQHWDDSHVFYSDKLVRHDLLKNEFCRANGITLVRIPFIGRKTTTSYVSNILLEYLPSRETTSSEDSSQE